MRLGRRLLVGEDALGAGLTELECADHARGLQGVAGLVVVPHPVHVERGLVVGAEHIDVQPVMEEVARVLVPVSAVRLGRQVDVHDVPWRTGAEQLALGVVDHVVRRSSHLAEVEPLDVVEHTGKGLEAGHARMTTRCKDAAMPRANNNGIEIEYDTIGDPSDEPLLLVMGFTAQLIAWDDKLCQALADKGYFVIRYDNRDCGLSSHLDGVMFDMGELFNAMHGGRRGARPCRTRCPTWLPTASRCSTRSASTVPTSSGASMGGMIVQTMAIEHPERLRTVTSIMSMTGEPDYGQAAPEAMAALMRPPPEDRAQAIEASVEGSKIFSSPRYFDATRALVSGLARRTTARSIPRVPVARWAPSSRAAIEPTAFATSSCRSS